MNIAPDSGANITGYTKLGLNQAIGRNGEKGVDPSAMLMQLKTQKVIQRENSATIYRGKTRQSYLK